MGTLLDEVFGLLEVATRLEKEEDTRIEAATKYYEAVYLMKQYLQRLPTTSEQQQKRELLEEKTKHYERVAQKCLASCSASSVGSPCSDEKRSVASDPRSPVARNGFFNGDSSVIPMPAPVPPPVETARFSLSTQLSQTTSQANTKLAHAMDIDESRDEQAAIAMYLEAAELYLKAIKISEDKNSGAEANVVNVLKRRLEQTLDRVEQLKNPNAKRQHAAIEKILREGKQLQQSQPLASSLSPEEISVLKRSSLIASGLFFPWSDVEAETLNKAKKSSMNLWRDPAGDIVLSAKQQKTFVKWARPLEILQLRQQLRGGSSKIMNPTMVLRNVSPYNIRQYGVTDCSFIASLCICAAYERRFQKSLVSPIVYPQTPDGRMAYNPEGQYMVKLWLNGVARQVLVDDRLPIDRNGNLLCAHTQCPPGQLEIYVPIIEKAFIKMAGGYDFPGSNSGVDLYSLTGWIPERILFPKDPPKIRDFETEPERAWERLMSAHSFGDCLITMSSDASVTDEEADRLGLITGHAYAILNVIQTTNGTRLLQMKNPWAHKGWKGRYSCYDTQGWSDPCFRSEVGYNPDVAREQDDGVFWICWEDVLVYYQNIHLSWNPALFRYRTSTHGLWPKDQGMYFDISCN